MIRLWLTFSVVVLLAGCDRPQLADAVQETPRQPPSFDSQPVARWDAYNYRPPFYAGDELLIYEDGHCVLLRPAAEPHPFCHWKADRENRFEIRFGSAAEALVTATGFLAASALADLGADDSPRYLYLDFGQGRARVYVLDGSRDAEMVRMAVEAEQAWTRQEVWKAIGKYQQAVDMGSPYARMRLGWILATTQELLDAHHAIALLEPIKDRSNYHVARALGAAYAAAGDFRSAVEEATRACGLARSQSPRHDECLFQLSRYRQRKVYVVSLNQGAASQPQ